MIEVALAKALSSEAIDALLRAVVQLPAAVTPLSENAKVAAGGIDPAKIPQTLDDLEELQSFSYDLSATRAAEINVPVIGSPVSANDSRRVVIMEWTRFKPLTDDAGIIYRYGFVVRFCLTVDKWGAEFKTSLPFLSAKAELGVLQASWMMQVRGLVGPKIDEVVVPPQPLNVETFVIARQSIANLIAAIRDPATKFKPGVMLTRIDPTSANERFRKAAVEASALISLGKGLAETKARERARITDNGQAEIVHDVYESLGQSDPTAKPSDAARSAADKILGSTQFS